MRSPKDVVTDWAATYNARDPYALIELYHDDAENIQVALGETVRGRDELQESFITLFKAFPDNQIHIDNVFQDGEWCIIEWSGSGSFLSALGDELPATGESYTLRGCGFFHVVDGKIRCQRGYFDKHTWLSQIGIPL
jgi:steroid delta-isomerase-like uncharacterized protein